MLLVALFSFMLISPLVRASDADSTLPACCRRGGMHKCAMMASQTASSGQFARAGRCPLFPSAKAIPPGQTVTLRVAVCATVAGLISRPAPGSQAQTPYRMSYRRPGQERAPPSSFS